MAGIRILLESSSQGSGPTYLWEDISINVGSQSWDTNGSLPGLEEVISAYADEFADLLVAFVEAKLPVFNGDITRVLVTRQVTDELYTTIP